MKTIVCIAGMAVAAGANAIIIDDFTSGPYANTIMSGSIIAQQNGTMIGGQRDLLMTVVNNGIGQNLQQTIGSGMSITSSGTLLTARIGLDYDGIDTENPVASAFNAGAGFAPTLDLINQTNIVIHFLANDRTLNLEARVRGVGGGVSTQNVVVAGNNDNPFDVYLPSASFAGSANMAQINRLEFYFNTSPSGDFALGSINTVPEPMSIFGLGAAVLGLLIARRKR